MKLTLLALTYFQKTAELQHLTHAAEALHISQPSLSHTIKMLPVQGHRQPGGGVGRPPVSPIRKKHRPHQVRGNPSQPYKQDYERT